MKNLPRFVLLRGLFSIIVAVLLLPQPNRAEPVLVLDASALSLQDEDPVLEWSGVSANGTPRFQRFQTPGGRPAVLFDGSAHFGQVTLPSFAGDFIIAAVISPNDLNAYHNIVDDDAMQRPMLWVDNRSPSTYEANFSPTGAIAAETGGTGNRGWDIIIMDSQFGDFYLNSPSLTHSINAIPWLPDGGSQGFSLFNRSGGQVFQGRVAELRIYNDAAAFGLNFAGLYQELFDKWFTGGAELPVVELVSPAPGTIFAAPASITLTAAASATDGQVVQVEFFSGEMSVGTVTEPPFTLLWSGVLAGSHTLTARATDSHGQRATSEAVQIAVRPAAPGPEGFVLHLDASALALQDGDPVIGWGGVAASGTPRFDRFQTPGGRPAVFFDGSAHFGQVNLSSSFAGDFIVAAVISPNDINGYHNIVDAAERPMLWVDNRSPSTYEANFSPTGAIAAETGGTGDRGWDIIIMDSQLGNFYLNSPDVTHSINAIPWLPAAGTQGFSLFNRGGGQAFQGRVAELRIYSDSSAFNSDFAGLYQELFDKWFTGTGLPVVEMVSPAPGTVFTAPANITLTAEASDPGGQIVQVDFFAGDNLIGTVTAPPFTFTWGNVLARSYTLTARATDNDGQRATSEPVQIAVRPAPTGVEGLVLHFDASALNLQDGNTVVGWGSVAAVGGPRFERAQTPGGGPAVLFGGSAHFGQIILPSSSAGDFIVAAVISPDDINAYHNIVDDDAGQRPMLWVDNRAPSTYEANFSPTGAIATEDGGTGVQGWDIIIMDSQAGGFYLNSPSVTHSINEIPWLPAAGSQGFSLFNRGGGQGFQGRVAELRIYNNTAAFGSNFAGLYQELFDKWFTGFPPGLQITEVRFDAVTRGLTLTWPTEMGRSYMVRAKTNLSDATWVELARDIAGTGGSVSWTDGGDGNLQSRFYQIGEN
jgi:hypothetical protein